MMGRTFVKAVSVGSAVEAEQILQLLKTNKIFAYRQKSIMDFYTGTSIDGEDIMVLKEEQEKAEEVLEEFQPVKAEWNHKLIWKTQMISGRILLGIMAMILIGCVLLVIL